jgi:hypothetical protein
MNDRPAARVALGTRLRNTTRFSWTTSSRPLRAASRSVRTCTPSLLASSWSDRRRSGSWLFASARALSSQNSGTCRLPESHVRHVSVETPRSSANCDCVSLSRRRRFRISSSVSPVLCGIAPSPLAHVGRRTPLEYFTELEADRSVGRHKMAAFRGHKREEQNLARKARPPRLERGTPGLEAR